jgi:hypothetical protein
LLLAPPVTFFSILSIEKFWARSTGHWAPHYVVFSTPVTSSLLGTNILLSILLSNTLNLRSSLNVIAQFSHVTQLLIFFRNFK